MKHLKNKSTIIQQLSLKSRAHNSLELSETLTKLFIEKDHRDWTNYLLKADYPTDQYEVITANIITSILILVPTWSGEGVVKIVHAIFGVESGGTSFLFDHYLPMVNESLSDVKVSLVDWVILARLIIGTAGIKLVWSFAFLEEFITPSILMSEVGIWLGGYTVALVNIIADTISGQTQTDLGVQLAWNVYPGDSKCRHE